MNRIFLALMVALFASFVNIAGANAQESYAIDTINDDRIGWLLIKVALLVVLIFGPAYLLLLGLAGSYKYQDNRRKVNGSIGRALLATGTVLKIAIHGTLLVPAGAILWWTGKVLWRVVLWTAYWLRYDALDCVILTLYVPILLFDEFKDHIKKNVRLARRRAHLQP